MRIGELASRSGMTTKTIRFWESTGLLADPTRTPSGYRVYGPEAIDRLEFIRHAKTAGLTLDEIRQVLAISDGGQTPCEHVGELIHRHLTDLDQRIRELTDTRRRLRHLAKRAKTRQRATGTAPSFNHPEPGADQPPSIASSSSRGRRRTSG